MGLLLGFAVVTKQHALLAVPLVATWAVVRGADSRELIRAAALATIVAAATLAPFLLWNAGAFLGDTIVFVAGSGPCPPPLQSGGVSALPPSRGGVPCAPRGLPLPPPQGGGGGVGLAIGW